MDIYDVCFSVHEYDKDGYPMDEGIFLHFGGTRVKVARKFEEFQAIVARISGMEKEIEETYVLENGELK